MAPVSHDDSGIKTTTTSDVGSGTFTPQILLGIVLPLVAVASFIPVIMIRSHLRTKRIISQRSRARQAIYSARAQATPRLPMNSIYIARVDYYLPPSNTGASLSIAVAETPCVAEDNVSLSVGVDKDSNKLDCNYLSAPSQGLGLLPQAHPNGSLLSLSSMLGEFTVYADAIDSEPENLHLIEARRSSTCLLDSVFSSMDVNALSSTEFLDSPSLAPQRYPKVLTSLSMGASCSDDTGIEGVRFADVRSLSGNISSLAYEGHPTILEGLNDNSRCEDVGTLSVISEDVVEEISTSHLVPTTTTTSFILDSCSTLASFLAVRLSLFPAVPAFPIFPMISLAGRSITTRRSESSLGTISIAAPASLNILDIQLHGELPQQKQRLNGPYLIDWPSFSNPGELWDEEDDLLFSVCIPQKPIGLTKPVRHTWTAGIRYSRSDKGELWDDEDDRRFSFVGPSRPPDILVSSSMFSLEMSSDCDLGDSTLQSSEANSLADHDCEVRAAIEEVADQTLCCSEGDLDFKDLGFAELDLGFDFEECFTSFKEPNIKSNPRKQEGFMSDPDICSPVRSSLRRFAFENHSVETKSIYLSESSRSSLMSLASVLDRTIRVVDPAALYDCDYECEDRSKMFEVDVMEVENDSSYSSRIVSVNYPLVRFGEEYPF